MRKAFISAVLCVLLMAVVPAGAIVGGQPDEGRHPEVGAVVGFIPEAGREIAYCSGSLISTRVFLTAAHCAFAANPAAKVTFDEQYTESSPLHTGTIHVHPGWMREGNTPVNDVAVIVLDKPVRGIAPAQLPTAGLLDQMRLTQSSRFTAVGYGDTQFVNGPGGHTTTHPQSRSYSVSTFNSLSVAHLHLSQHLKKGEGGTCNGDSGGPNFIGAGADETSIIAGITVTGDIYCKATNVDFRLDTQVARDFLDDFVALP